MPPPGRMPTRAWVSANTARSEAIRKSQPSAISRPPVNVAPLIAPMIGVRMRRPPRCNSATRNSSKYVAPIALCLLEVDPAQNAGSAPVSTTARTESIGVGLGQRRVQAAESGRGSAHCGPAGRFSVISRTGAVVERSGRAVASVMAASSAQELVGAVGQIEQGLRQRAEGEGDGGA